MAGPSGFNNTVLNASDDDHDNSDFEDEFGSDDSFDYSSSDFEDEFDSDDSFDYSSSDFEDEFDSDDSIDYIPQWSSTTLGRPMHVIPFTKRNELLVPTPGQNKPLDWFLLLCDIRFLEQIVCATNKNACHLLGKQDLQPKSRINKWHDLTVDELKVFIGLIYQMGTVRTNRIADYWKTSRTFNFPFIREQMARDRFQVILRCLHFASNCTKDDKLSKIQFLIEHFNNKMSTVYYPCKELSIDEWMGMCRGCQHFRQYIKGKDHKSELKMFSLCESNGIVLRFMMYSGKDSNHNGIGHMDKVVMYLMSTKLNVGHSLFMRYNSFPLAVELLQKGTYSTGMLQKHEKYLPLEVASAKLSKGETVQRYCEGVMVAKGETVQRYCVGVMVAKWRDKGEVLYLSTEYENTMEISRNKHGVARDKPLPIIQYNNYMKGVYKSDQTMDYYPSDHKSLRWPTTIFVYVLQLLMTNANKLHNFANPNNKMPTYDFRQQVIEALLPPKEDLPPKRPRFTPHVLSKIIDRDNRNKIKQKRCRVCYKEGKVKKTVYTCYECPDQPGLCPVVCFEKFHSD